MVCVFSCICGWMWLCVRLMGFVKGILLLVMIVILLYRCLVWVMMWVEKIIVVFCWERLWIMFFSLFWLSVLRLENGLLKIIRCGWWISVLSSWICCVMFLESW